MTFGLSGCAVNPVTGKNELSWISTDEEINIGSQQYLPSQQSQGGQFLADPGLNDYINEVGKRVANAGDRDLPYEFIVLNNSVPNAWALPGGKIAINRGLLLELKDEAELAAVLGHEAVHAAAKHGANSLQRSQIMQGLVVATSIGASTTNYGNYIVGGAQVGAQMIGQKYGRDAELEADYYGIKYMSLAGYDPAAAIGLQQTFVRLSEGQASSWIDGLFASHPPSQSRVDANRTTISELNLPSGERYAERYRQKISFLYDNRHAYKKADIASSTEDLIEAHALVKGAINSVPTEAMFFGLQGNIYFQQKKFDQAKTSFNQALALDDSYYEYYLGRGLTYQQLGNTQAATQDLTRSHQLLPTAISSNALGRLALGRGERSEAKQYFQMAMGSNSQTGESASNNFILLDIPDNPSQYIGVNATTSDDQQLVAILSNKTTIDMTDIQIRVSAQIDGQALSRNFTVKSLNAAASLSVATGWQAATSISNVSIRILTANVAQ
jgi:predicted Zn-dependent protease